MIPVAEFRKWRDARCFSRALERRHLRSIIVRRAGRSFVYVLSVHFDEALAIYEEQRRHQAQTVRMSEFVELQAAPDAPMSLLEALRPLLMLFAALFGAAACRAAWGNTAPDAPATWLEVWLLAGGALVGLFTYRSGESMIRRFARRLRSALPRPRPPAAIAEPSAPNTASWSTLLTTWRSRRNTRSRAAWGPSSATNRS
jgi:hypothetical protein